MEAFRSECFLILEDANLIPESATIVLTLVHSFDDSTIVTNHERICSVEKGKIRSRFAKFMGRFNKKIIPKSI